MHNLFIIIIVFRVQFVLVKEHIKLALRLRLYLLAI